MYSPNDRLTLEAAAEAAQGRFATVIADSHEEIYLLDPTSTEEDLKTLILYRLM